MYGKGVKDASVGGMRWIVMDERMVTYTRLPFVILPKYYYSNPYSPPLP